MITSSAPFLENNLAVSVAAALATANKRAQEAGVDALQSALTITQEQVGAEAVWRINYGPKDYIGQRGGDLIIDVDCNDFTIKRVLRGQ